ncbi:uncharacterized protein LOC111391715 [Olea europaea var. sylvestris]|uniref:uncharacterized protein LOC111391715 n=1 Tax=Olea europaea var. sylvestris TaxID=158386 RepID=UPI000C1CDEA8|nr:uncharacterized protein LOC111391715 [Olea europaea var. sylvestris]
MAYNIILGRSRLKIIRAIVSTFHLAIKFPTSNGIWAIKAAKQWQENLELEHENHGRLAPIERLTEVELELSRKVTIERELDVAIMAKLISCLPRNINVFTLNVKDMPGIDPEFTVHRLNANRNYRVCIDFTKLNKACPKDSYPLPRIYNLVDSTSGHMLYSLLDAFSGYHQILMVEENQEKTSFMADLTIYRYRILPFELKNTKVQHEAQHPTKCAFGVASGKFLGFMITHKGIEANPDKIQALMSMETGRIKALNIKLSAGKGKKKGPVAYLLSKKVLLDAKTRYTLVEQLALALVVAAKKLRQYFQSHPIVVLINQSLRHIFQKPNVSRRLLK